MSAKYKILQYRVKVNKIVVYVIIVAWHNDLVIINAIVFIRGARLRYNSNEPVVANCERFTALFYRKRCTFCIFFFFFVFKILFINFVSSKDLPVLIMSKF